MKVLVGARVRGEEPVFPMVLTLVPRAGRPPAKGGLLSSAEVARLEAFAIQDAFLAYVNVTKDGRDVGAVALAEGPHAFEAGIGARMATDVFVGNVYNDTAKKRLAEGKNLPAADLFAKASAAWPANASFAYDLARAAAREDDPRARPALARAIAGAASSKARARKDPDFDRVRTADWFLSLTR